MKRTILLCLIAVSLHAQTQIRPEISKEQATTIVRIAVPRPEGVPLEAIEMPFFAPLTRDLAASGVFAIAPIPPNLPPDMNLAKAANAEYVLSLKFSKQEQDFVVAARLLDPTGLSQFGRG